MSWLPGSAAVQRGPSRAGGGGDPPLPIGWEASYSQPPLLSLSSHEKTTRSARGLGQPSAPAQGNDRFHRCESSIVAPKGPNPSTTCLVGLTMSGRRFCSGGKSPVFFLFFFPVLFNPPVTWLLDPQGLVFTDKTRDWRRPRCKCPRMLSGSCGACRRTARA